MNSTSVQPSRGAGHLTKYLRLTVGGRAAPHANPAPNPFQVADTYFEKGVVTTLMAIDAISHISPFRWLFDAKGCGRKEEEEGNDWISVPAGNFERGDNESKWDDEKPVKDIYVSTFQLQKHGITNKEYRSFLTIQRWKPFEAVVQCGNQPAQTISALTRDEFIGVYYKVKEVCANDKSFVISSVKSYPAEPIDYGAKFKGGNQPVVGVDWFGATAYCQSVGGRLPTEAEREKAAKGKSGHDKYAARKPNCNDYYYSQGPTANVCSYPISSFGFCDLSGNTWEWVADWFQEDAYQNSETRDPKGPVNGRTKVLRGGSWVSPCSHWRAAFRNYYRPDYRSYDVGFRCARQDS